MATLFASQFADTGQRAPLAVRAICIFVLLVLASVPVAASTNGDPIVVDANAIPCVKPAATHFTMIQDAVNAAPAGATILVCPGTYSEQITVKTPLTLKGVTVPDANNGTGAGAATITAPAGLVSNASYAGTAKPVAAQVLVQASNVILTNLAVDGSNAFSACSPLMLVGIDFEAGSSGSVQHVAVKNQNVPNQSGGYCNLGTGILANQGSLRVTVQDSVIYNFDSLGIDGEGPVEVERNVLSPVPGQTQALGVFLNSTAASSVTSNTVTASTVGIACISCPGDTLSGNTIFPSTVGVFVVGSGDIVKDNYIAAAALVGIFVLPSSGEKVNRNTINDAPVGIEGSAGNKVSDNKFFNVTTLME
jgi:nitrous oxidase accessory protein NosD